MLTNSYNLSDRLFFTVNLNGDTATIGELAGRQKLLVELTTEELRSLVRACETEMEFGETEGPERA